jgi:peptidoglycan/LPS O-acetylase OafA/YrhL
MGLALLLVGTTTLVAWLASEDFMSVINFWDAVQQPALIAILAGMITAGAIQLAGTSMPLTRLFRSLSKLGYGLYLVHYPLIPLVLAITAGRGGVVFWSFYFIVSLAAALLLHLVVERPFLKLKDRLALQTTTAALPV